MAVKYIVYANIEASDSAKENTAEDDCWHPSDEIDLAEFDSLEKAEQFMQALKRIKGLEAALQGMVPFIEDDFPNGTGKNHGTCATDKYQEACNVVMQVLKGE